MWTNYGHLFLRVLLAANGIFDWKLLENTDSRTCFPFQASVKCERAQQWDHLQATLRSQIWQVQTPPQRLERLL